MSYKISDIAIATVPHPSGDGTQVHFSPPLPVEIFVELSKDRNTFFGVAPGFGVGFIANGPFDIGQMTVAAVMQAVEDALTVDQSKLPPWKRNETRALLELVKDQATAPT